MIRTYIHTYIHSFESQYSYKRNTYKSSSIEHAVVTSKSFNKGDLGATTPILWV